MVYHFHIDTITKLPWSSATRDNTECKSIEMSHHSRHYTDKIEQEKLEN